MSKKKRRNKTFKTPENFHISKIRTRGQNQYDYLTALEEHPVVFSVGPAGVGKTLLAVAWGLHMYYLGEIQRIILTRPACQAGEDLGFLPGSLEEKMDPYMRPIYDFLKKYMSATAIKMMLEQEIIEIVPLAFMRGRTFDDAFIILDEAQNTTPEQMKMCLTRMGMDSQMVITGDLNQSDIRKQNGLAHALEKLEKIDEIAVIRFDSHDVVRNPIVSKMIDAYEEEESNDSISGSTN